MASIQLRHHTWATESIPRQGGAKAPQALAARLWAQNQISRGNLSLSDSDGLRFLLIFDFWDSWAREGRRARGGPPVVSELVSE